MFFKFIISYTTILFESVGRKDDSSTVSTISLEMRLNTIDGRKSFCVIKNEEKLALNTETCIKSVLRTEENYYKTNVLILCLIVATNGKQRIHSIDLALITFVTSLSNDVVSYITFLHYVVFFLCKSGKYTIIF